MARAMCMYCGKWFDQKEKSQLPLDDQPHLDRQYCSRCFPEVKEAHLNLPWIKKKGLTFRVTGSNSGFK